MAIGIARRCGALAGADGVVTWRVWAPRADRVDLVLIDGDRRRETPMRPDGQGYFGYVDSRVADGQPYAYRLNGGEERADPCSLWQPRGVPGPSAVVRTDRFEWSDARWRGVPRQDLVIYELHVGTFTPEGTFDAIIPRLTTLRELGVTALEIMPVNQFPGGRNWGYDGVLPYAAQDTYGGPHGLAKLVDSAHATGLAVILDVVYNHFGPESNYLHEFGPYFTDKYKTPWGAAINFDDRGSDAVRDFVLDNTRMWLDEFHLDGLRLDAVHAIYDLGARHTLQSIKDAAADITRRNGRHIHVIGESDLNDPKVILPPERGGWGLDGQWADDFHHAVHALLTGERRGYYSDYGEPAHVARALQTPFVYAWDYSPHRQRKHGAPLPPDIPGDRFVVCIQNHDQVGNRARGDRLITLLDHPAKQRLASSLLLLAPYVPLLFMGEEYGETRPFPFFCSFRGPELIQAVREGRTRECADFVSSAEEIPDPDAVETFASAKLTWSWPEGSPQGGLRRLYQDLLSVRRDWPALKDFVNRTASFVGGGGREVLELTRGGSGDGIRAHFNPTPRRQALGRSGSARVLFRSESARYHGAREQGEVSAGELLPFECVVVGPAGLRELS